MTSSQPALTSSPFFTWVSIIFYPMCVKTIFLHPQFLMKLPHRILLAEDKQCSQCQKTDSGTDYWRYGKLHDSSPNQYHRNQSCNSGLYKINRYSSLSRRFIFAITGTENCTANIPKGITKSTDQPFHPVNRSHRIAITDMSKSPSLGFSTLFFES